MPTAAARPSPRPAAPDDLRVLATRLRAPEDRPIPEEDAPFEGVPDDYYGAVVGHLERHLGASDGFFGDTEGPFAIDVKLVEPGGRRDWGAVYTVGSGARGVAGRPLPGPGEAARVELIARLPGASFRYADREAQILECFNDLHDAVVDALGELARLPHLKSLLYAPPHIVVTPDLSPLVEHLPFAGVLLRDARRSRLGARRRPRPGPGPIDVPGHGVVTFLTVTFLHASEVAALTGPRRGDALRLLDAAGVDELVDAERAAVM